MENQLPTIVLAALAVGLLLFANRIGAPAAEASQGQAETATTAPSSAATSSAPVAVAPTPAPAPAPEPTTAAEPAEAPEPAPAEPTPAPAKPSPAPTTAPTPPAPTERPVNAVNPDDAPAVVEKGKAPRSTNAELPPAYGPNPAKVHVIIFSDFQCPVCRRAKEATHQLAQEFPGEVRLEFWNHALDMHRNAEIAARASLAAQQQGKFWEYHDLLFENQAALDELSLMSYAEQLGLDMAKFRADFNSQKLKDRVKKEGELAEALGARGTPAFVINGKLSVGWGSWNGFRGMVERELTQAKELAKSGKSDHQVHEERAKLNAESPEAFQAYLNNVLTPLAAAE